MSLRGSFLIEVVCGRYDYCGKIVLECVEWCWFPTSVDRDCPIFGGKQVMFA